MKKQKGSALVIALSALGFIGVIVVVLVMSYVSAFNTGNALEKGIKATYENNKNVLATYGQKVLEVTQVPEMMRDDIVKVTQAAISGRYGAEGSKAVFQAITEQNPQVDPAVYRKIQQVIEGGRTEFQNSQTRLIDQKRVYETALGTFWGGMWLRIAGYPKVNLSDYKVISTDRAEKVFEAGKENGPIQLRAPVPAVK